MRLGRAAVRSAVGCWKQAVHFSDVGEDRAVERSSRLHFILLDLFVDVSISC